MFVKNHSLMDFKEKEKNIYMFYRAKLTLNFALALVWQSGLPIFAIRGFKIDGLPGHSDSCIANS